MANNSIIEIQLKKESGKPSAILPRDIDISQVGKSIIINIHSKFTLENMQKDPSAFEGWAIILKRWLKNIEQIIFSWEDPIFHFTTFPQRQHYQRFLYRMRNFCDSYSWAEIDRKNQASFNQFVIPTDGDNILNIPSKPRRKLFNTLMELTKYSECQLEEFILTHSKTLEEFKKFSNLKKVNNQLPVGVFKKEKKNSTKIFPGSKSAIDIWGINNKQEICIYELKNFKNNKIGCLSEMLFYSHLINDVIHSKIRFESINYIELKEILNSKKVNCFLLASHSHPLIDDKVFELLNKNISGIFYGNIEISKTANCLAFR